MGKLAFKRILLKVSGEVLMGGQPFGIDLKTVGLLADEIIACAAKGAEVALVIGGGNIFRGLAGAAKGMDRVSADHMGIMATIMNALAMQGTLNSKGADARVLSAIPMPTVCETYSPAKGIHHLKQGRIVICAAEDVGLADPMALVLAQAAHQAAEFIGWPEARLPIAEATIYIATAAKSNSAYTAIDAALEDVRSGRTLAVPEHLRDTHYAGAQRLGHGAGYQYAHDYPEHFVPQNYLTETRRYYEPTEQGVEKKIKERLEKWRSLQAAAKK